MPGLYFRASKFKLNSGGFNKRLDAAIKSQMRRAAKRFLEAAIYEAVKAGFPVDTGMALGSYLNLSRALGFALSINPSSLKRKYYYGDNARGAVKSPELGASLSTNYRSKDTVIKKRGNLYYFEFESNVFHYTMLDFFAVKQNPNSPWNTFQVGKEAFLEYMRTKAIKKLPKVTQFIQRTVIEVNESGGINQTEIQSDSLTTITD